MELFEACRQIARSFDIEAIEDIGFEEEGSVSEKIFRFCERNRIGVRELDLKEAVANVEEPMLFFVSGHPLVRFPKMVTESCLPTTAQGPAFAFYRALPSAVKTPWELFLFGIRGKKRLLILTLAVSALASLLRLFPLFTIKWVIEQIDLQGTVSYHTEISAGLLLAAFFSTFFFYLRNCALIRFSGLLASAIQPALWSRFFHLKLSFFRKHQKGELIEKAFLLEDLREKVGQLLSSAAFLSVLALFDFLAMLYFSPILTAAIIAPVGLFFVFAALVKRKAAPLKEKNLLDGEIEGFLSQCFHAIMRIRASGAEERVFGVWRHQAEKRDCLEVSGLKARIAITAVKMVFPFLAAGCVLVCWIFFWEAVQISDAFAFLIGLLFFCGAFYDLGFHFFEVFSILPAMKKAEQLFLEPLEKGDEDPGKLDGSVDFKSVTFRFDENGPSVFENLSLSICAGEKIGFVGASGSGKSTLVRLLLGFETPEKGEILLGGQSLAGLRLSLVRKQIGSIFASEGIFKATIFENIDAGRGCSQHQIDEALKLSGFGKELDHMPMGLQTLLPEAGETLSGSQKQKLLLARALAFDPALVIIDEGIDSLDLPSKEEILENLKQVSATQLIISRDEALLRKYVDRVYKLDMKSLK